LTDSCKFQTEAIASVQYFNFAFKFPENGRFLAPTFVFLEEKVPTRKKINRLNLDDANAACSVLI